MQDLQRSIGSLLENPSNLDFKILQKIKRQTEQLLALVRESRIELNFINGEFGSFRFQKPNIKPFALSDLDFKLNPSDIVQMIPEPIGFWDLTLFFLLGGAPAGAMDQDEYADGALLNPPLFFRHDLNHGVIRLVTRLFLSSESANIFFDGRAKFAKAYLKVRNFCRALAMSRAQITDAQDLETFDALVFYVLHEQGTTTHHNLALMLRRSLSDAYTLPNLRNRIRPTDMKLVYGWNEARFKRVRDRIFAEASRENWIQVHPE